MFFVWYNVYPRASRGLSGEELNCQCRKHRFDPWVRKIPWKRKWQHTPVFLPQKSHGQRSLTGHCPWSHERGRYDLATNQQQLFILSKLLKLRVHKVFLDISLQIYFLICKMEIVLLWGFSGSLVVNTLTSSTGGVISGWGANITHASGSKNQSYKMEEIL